MIALRRAELSARKGEFGPARAMLSEAVESAAGIEDRLLMRSMLASLCWRMGDRDAATALREETLRDVGQLGSARPDHAHGRAIVFGLAARMVAEEGDLDRARELLGAAHAAAVEAHDLPIAGRVGEAAAVLALRAGRPADAAELLGAAMRLRGTDDVTHPDTAALLAELRDALDERALAAGLEAGRALDREAALARLAPAP
jgi:hypothetical protein